MTVSLRRSPSRATALSLGILLALSFALPLAAQQKPTLTPADYGRWEVLGASRFAPNGDWLAIAITRGNEENELRLRHTTRDETVTIPFGTQAAFSADSRWVGWLVTVSPKERDRLTKERKPIRTSFGARKLGSTDTISLNEVSGFSFSADGRFVALTRYPAEGKRVQDVVVHDLSSGARFVLSGVGEHSWAEVSALLAFTQPGEGGTGSSVMLFDGRSGATRVLETGTTPYRAIAWRPRTADLAVLRTVVDKAFADTAHVLISWTGVDVPTATARTLDPFATKGAIVAELRISEGRRPTWSRDGAVIYLGLRSREPVATQPKKSEEKVSDVEIWHSKDVRVIPQQRSSESGDLRATLLASWRIGGTTVTPIGTDLQESVTILEGDRHAIETDRKPYGWGQMFGRRDQDAWVIDLSTGSRTKALEKVRFQFGGDPTGRRVAWFDGKDYWALEVATGKRTNLTAPLTSSKRADFVDRDDDHPSDVLSPVGSPSWTKDGARMIVADQVDLWSLALDGSGGTRLTDGAAQGLQHRIVSFAPFNAPAAERAVDLTKPVYLSLYGRRTKQSGYGRLVAGRVERLILADAQVGALTRADSAARYAFTRQRFDESPALHVGGASLADARPVMTTNPFKAEYAWGKAELVDFNSTIGTPLQAILYYPANHDPSKKYPMIVYTYELLSQGYHRFITPRENDYYNANTFTQQGYFVLMPDIVFKAREPGISVLQAVEGAVKAVLARGLVDSARVGHAGHSQGGYEAAYLVTHSKMFCTAVMGAGISDMISFAGQMHWSSVPEFDHWETGQFRMEVAPWEDFDAMLKNSPLHRAHEMAAKSILIEIGSEDPTVDMRQGVLFYNYLRRAGKDAVMLNYPGEGHGLGKRENAIDYQRRILQWFAHYLKDEPPAKWIAEGQTWLDRKKVLDANK
jgi:dipeptidyl aminopeptidase/acylaminoacyl peptidase